MRSNLKRISLTLMFLIIAGCAWDSRVKLKDIEDYWTEIESKVKATDPETLRQAKIRIAVSRPLPVVYKAALNALGNLENTAIITPVSHQAQNETTARIIYADREPIFHGKKPINAAASNSLYVEDLRIYVSILMEPQDANTTIAYFYPHHNLCYKIPDNLKGVVDSNMHYRGSVFAYRLETQLAGQAKWQWIKSQ